jgi:hypothetical protein
VPPDERRDEDELDGDFVVDRAFVPEVEPPLLDFVPELERLVVRRELDDDPPLLLDCCEPPESPSESSSDPRSFFPTPTAAAVASPTAAPVATFFGVDMPSDPSSSAAMISPPLLR